MLNRDPRVDAYIEKSAPFAQPILRRLRELVHQGCPAVEETVKWSSPFFMRQGILGSMCAFKAHCAFNFWNGKEYLGEEALGKAGEAMGQFGRMTKLEDLPDEEMFLECVRKAARFNESRGVLVKKSKQSSATELPIPEALAAALRQNRKAGAAFERFSLSHRKEYARWIAEAKREETRQRRVEQAIKWLAEGKPRH